MHAAQQAKPWSPTHEAELFDLLERKRLSDAARSLLDYCRTITIPGAPINDDDDCEQFYPDSVTPAEHHRLIINTMQRIDAGEIRRCMIFMPPGSAKSTYASICFPTWYMGRHPGANIISVSYASELANRFGRRCRQITRSPEYAEIFRTQLLADNRAAHDWSLSNNATYKSGGIQSGISGNRADGLVIDDPIRGRQDADSEVVRNTTWEAYRNDARTRVKPRGWILLIQTRWHEDDLAGRILPATYAGESGWIEARDGEPWFVLCLPAEAEHDTDPLGRRPGDWLWPEWFPPAWWEQEKRTQGGRNWSALYQQRPSPAEGSLIKRAWPRRYTTAPAAGEILFLAQSWDTAYKPKQINDPSVCTTWAITRSGFYLLDVWRARQEFPELKRTAVNLARRATALYHKPVAAVLVEDKGSGTSLIQEMNANREHLLPVIGIDPQGVDKTNRLVAVSPLFESGLVYFPQEADWLIDYEMELFGFPLVAHDDQVDSTSQFLSWAQHMHNRIDSAGLGQTRAAYEEGGRPQQDRHGRLRSPNDFRGFD